MHKIAFEVAVGINRTSPLTANGLLALTLLGVRDQSLTLKQIQRILAPLLRDRDDVGLTDIDGAAEEPVRAQQHCLFAPILFHS